MHLWQNYNLNLHQVQINSTFNINKRIKIRNLNSDGELDNTYGDNGEFIIPEFTFEPGFQQNFNYDSISNQIYFFAYNGSSQSKLFVVKSDGSLDTNYELNGGFYLGVNYN